MRVRVAIAFACALACLSSISLASENTDTPQQSALVLERTQHLPDKPDKVIGSLFNPTGVVGRASKYAFIAIPGGSYAGAPQVDSPFGVDASRNGRFVIIHVLEDPSQPEGSVISTLYELPGMRRIWSRTGPDAKALISDDGKTVVFHNVGMMAFPTLEFYDEKGLVRAYRPPANTQGRVALAPSGSFVLVGAGANPSADAKITKYDRSGREVTVFDPKMGPLWLLEISPDGSRVAAYFNAMGPERKSQAYLLDAQMNEITAGDWGTPYLSQVVFSPDSSRFLAGSDEFLQLRDSRTGKVVWEQMEEDLLGSQHWNRIALSRDGRRVALSASARRSNTSSEVAESSLLILDESGRMMGRLNRGANAPSIEQLEFSADGQKLAVHIKGDGIDHYPVPATGGMKK